MATPEGKVKKAVKELLALYGDELYSNWPVPGGFGSPMLDAVCCYRGYFFMIETKRPGEKLTPRQEFTRQQVLDAGGRVYVIGEDIENDPDTWCLEHGSWSGMTALKGWLDYLQTRSRSE